jgi:hypothetical protein
MQGGILVEGRMIPTSMKYPVEEGVIVSVCIVVFVLQYIGRCFDLDYIKVSFYLTLIVKGLRWLARILGTAYGYIATFPSLIQFWELYMTFCEIVQPVLDLLILPFDYRDAVVATAKKVASVEHMRIGSIILAWMAFMWWRGYFEEIYMGMIGIVVGCMIFAHLLAKTIMDPPADNDEEEVHNPDNPAGEIGATTKMSTASLDSPPPKRRPRRRTVKNGAIVPASSAFVTV